MRGDPTDKILSRGFDYDRVVGAAAKEILRSLLESSGYTVYPFGYESTFYAVKQRLREKRLQKNDLAQRIRSMPDFLVADDEELPQLVEVKFRKTWEAQAKQMVGFGNWEIGRYKQFWPESVLVLLSPFGDRFFAQFVKNLDIEGDPYGRTMFEYTAFSSISNIFQRTSGKLGPFCVGIDKLANLWKEEKAPTSSINKH